MLDRLSGNPGSHRKVKRVGRGLGSGHGRTAARGYKGQQSRSGGGTHPRFEGGQTPLHRRIPKRGFTNIFRREFAVVNLSDLARVPAEVRDITPDLLLEMGMIRKMRSGLKVLGDGTLSRALRVRAHSFSKSAREGIEKAGGQVEVIGR